MAPRANAKRKKLLTLLSESLSDTELKELLPAVLLSLDKAARKRLMLQLDADTAATLDAVLTSVARGTRPKLGKRKLIQEWHQAWAEWNRIVEETSCAEGSYCRQDEHWRPPYFDATSARDDLDTVAARLRKLLPDIVAQDLDPELSMVESLRETAESLAAGLPEWFGDPETGCEFGPKVTQLLLDWEWSATETGDLPDASKRSFALADRLCALEWSASDLELDADTTIAFFLGLGARDTKKLLAGIEAARHAGHWERALACPDSAWFLIYQELCRDVRPELYLESCRENVATDWTLAVPVATDLVHRKQLEEAVAMIEETMSSMLRHSTVARWDPTKNLLARIALYERGSVHDDARRQLLRLWSKVSRTRGLGEVAWALDLQITLCKHWDNWDKTLAAFAETPTTRPQSTHDGLLVEWRKLVVERSLCGNGEAAWVGLLADAAQRKCATQGVSVAAHHVGETPPHHRCPGQVTPDLASRGCTGPVPTGSKSSCS